MAARISFLQKETASSLLPAAGKASARALLAVDAAGACGSC